MRTRKKSAHIRRTCVREKHLFFQTKQKIAFFPRPSLHRENDVFFQKSKKKKAKKSRTDLLNLCAIFYSNHRFCKQSFAKYYLATSSMIKASRISPSLMSLNFSRPTPHSYPSATSFTSSLKRRSEEILSSKITTPSRTTRI